MFTLVARGPQGYKVVRYNAFRYLDSKEGSDGAHDDDEEEKEEEEGEEELDAS